MDKIFLTLISVLFLVSFQVKADVNFKVQTSKETLPQAKAEQKLILYVCSADICSHCKWMDTFVYTDEELASTLNQKFIPIKPLASKDRLEYHSNCKILPSMIFMNENGKTVHKVEGKKTLSEMKTIVEQVLSRNCTGLNEKLDESAGTYKGSNCCEGLAKDTNSEEPICVKRACAEKSELGIQYDGDPRAALPCCDDSAERRIIMKISGFLVHCIDQSKLKEINQSERKDLKPRFQPANQFKKKKIDSTGKPY